MKHSVSSLTDNKQKLLKLLLQKKGISFNTKTIPRRPESSSAPLSFAQARLWFLNQLKEKSVAYNLPNAVQITGNLNVAGFEHAIKEIVRRHEVLRTSYHTVNGQPVQVIDKSATVTLPVVDLQELPELEQSTVVQHLTAFEAQQPFDLSKTPLIRVTLLRLGQQSHVLVLSMHHIVSDGWSMRIFVQELSTLYTAFRSGKPNPLPELPIQYADFAVWQQQWLREQVLETQLNYWKQQLAGVPPLLELPLTKPHPPVKTSHGRSIEFQLSLELSEKLNTISQNTGVSLFMTLLAGFATLLWRYTHQNDILIGTPIANRNRLEVESLIGFFVNTLVLRTQIQGNPSFAQLLQQVEQVTLKAYEHQDVPFDLVVEALQPERSLKHSPLFQVMFVLQNAPMGNLELPGLVLTPLEIKTVTSKFDLTLSMMETPQGLLGTWEYNTDLFDRETIARMAGHFQTMLAAIVTNPQQPVGDLPLLSDAERLQLLGEWSQTQTNYPTNKCVHTLFEEQVQRTPDAVALVFEDQQLTYSELNTDANKIAHYLQSLGVGPEVLVGLCVERSPEMVLGVLGILKAGGAYVPLDPTYPQERLAFMLSDSQMPVLLSQQKLLTKLTEIKARVVYLDTDWRRISQESEENTLSSVTTRNLAYVIYTSGSTGKPKGTMLAHQGLVNYLSWCVKAYEVENGYGSPVNSSIGFDATITSFFSPLLVGQTVLLLPEKQEIEALSAALCSQSNFSLVKITPAHLDLLNQLLPIEQAKHQTRALIIGGESLSGKSLSFWRTYAPETRIINEYGPTETVVGCCVYEVEAETPLLGAVPIGRPIANTQIYLLDRNLQALPIGIPGEIYIGGAGVARGYLNRPDLTAEKFVPNPFSQEPGARIYKTGDLARYLPNGNIEYLNRIDNQVKIRGFRIELGEIEVALSIHPHVRQVVVIAHEDTTKSKCLVAYIVANQESPTTTELRSFLKQKLPDYMVPTKFVFLDTLALTPNGKVDRLALRAPDWEHRDSVNFVLPHTDTQQVIANIIAEVLQIKQVGLEDNYFELGGHSLNATQVVSRLRDSFNLELPLRCLFEFPTVAELDQYIRNQRQTLLGLQLPAIEPVPRDTQNLPLSWAQTRLWFFEQFEGGTAIYNIPAAVQITGVLNINALEQSLKEIVRRHEVLRTSYHTVNGQPVQVISDDATVTLPVVDLQQLPFVEQSTVVRRLATLEAQQPFDLSNSPLLRVTVLRLHPQQSVLLLCMHHIISDGWSMGIFIQELSSVYVALASGKPNPLPELPIQYADFAVWQQQWLREQVLEAQLNYWKQQLAGAPPLLELPTDKPRPASQTFQGSSWSISLSQDLTQKLNAISRKSGVTLFMTLLAAFATLLWRYTRQDDILIGTPIANRNRLEVEPLIGFFVNTLVLRTQIQAELSFEKLLKQVQQLTLSAYEHQDIPFEQVVEACGPERSLDHSPLFQVMFALQNTPMGKLELPNLTLTPLELEIVTSKFDLSLLMVESSQGLVGTWEYNTDLFDQETIARMAGHFQTLLEAIVAHPQQEVWKLPLLSDAEEHQLLVRWNQTKTDYPDDQCIHQLFESQVQSTPDAVAVVFEHQQITYWELNARANQLAHYLQLHGVRQHALVGICMERSVDLLIGILAILKVGGVYVPLDPTYPEQRLSYMLTDAQVPVVLTYASLAPTFAQHQVQVVCLDSQQPQICQHQQTNLSVETAATDLAYVIYTSGSTGKPKGVAVPHRAVLRLVINTNYIHLETLDIVAFTSNTAFDAATFEIWGALLHGARLVVIPKDELLSIATFAMHLQVQAVSVMFMTTALFNQIASQVPEAFRFLRCLLFGGEAVDPRRVQQVLQYGPPKQLLHVYGPTENTTFSSWYLVDNVSDDAKTLPIGDAIANTQLYILDHYCQIVPIGVPGELYVGGDGLAIGYLNRPDLTAQKFVPNPLGNEPGARLYKTGDLARYLPDGNLEFLGRIDNQVKIRGFRIELEEIEAKLNEHPLVRDTVVIVRENASGDKRLVAYVVVNQATALSKQELYHFLKAKLPEYMVPSAFVMLDTLPLTPNGKLDRKALPAPSASQAELTTAFVAPCTFIEESLATIWKETLGLKQVGIYDNFFELGGDSIISIQIIARASQLGIQFTPKQLFQYQTIAELASVASTTNSIQAEQGTVSGDVPLTPIQHLFFEENLPCPNHFNQSLLLEVPSNLKPELLEHIVEKLLAHHDALRLRFTKDESHWRQTNIHSHDIVPFQVIDLSVLPSQEQQTALQIAAAEIQTTLNLSSGPLMRVVLFNLGIISSSRLLLVIHHLVVDGVSWRILLEDLYTTYQQLEHGEVIQLPPKTTSFKQWAIRLNNYGQSDTLAEELDCWLTPSRSHVAPLPVDYPATQAANTVASAANVSVSLSVEQTSALLQEVPQAYNTQINDVLLTALLQTFARWIGSGKLLVNLEGHGREELFEDVNLSRTVGWFTTVFPVLLDLRHIDHLGEALKSVKEQLRSVPQRGIGYGILRYLNSDSGVRSQLLILPKAEVSFNYLGQFDQVFSESVQWKFAQESSGASQNPLGSRSHLLDITGIVVEGKLELNWIYSKNVHKQATVELLADGFVKALTSVIHHCQLPEAVGYTPSDFPEAEFNQQELDELIAKID